MDSFMDSNEKHMLEQIAGIAMSSADLTGQLVFRLVNLELIDAGQAVAILSDMSCHQHNLATRNANMPGSAHIHGQIADRLDQYLVRLKKDRVLETMSLEASIN